MAVLNRVWRSDLNMSIKGIKIPEIFDWECLAVDHTGGRDLRYLLNVTLCGSPISQSGRRTRTTRVVIEHITS